MKSILLAVLVACGSAAPLVAADLSFQPVENWLSPAEGAKTIGNAHGDIAVSSTGDVYVSIQGPMGGVKVFGPDGKFLRTVPDAPNDFHGFVIHQEADGEFLYGARLAGQSILKMQLDGKVVLEIPGAMIPDEFKKMQNGKPVLRLTSVDVAPDGHIYAVDGYSSDFIHVFDTRGKYVRSFGGKEAPCSFKTCHKICIDTRFEPPRILCCDRENRRVVQISLEGEVLQVIPEMKRPAAIAVQGDFAAVGEIEGRVTLLDKEGKSVLQLGANPVKEQTATNQVKPEDWKTGIFTAPHGVDFAPNGDLFVTEYNIYGRVVRYNAAN